MIRRTPVALRKPLHPLLLVGVMLLSAASQTIAQRITTPEEHFGHKIGADYVLPNYTQFTAYFEKIDRESDRMTLQSIGKTAEGREQLMAIITSPQNHRNLARYKEIASRLANAEGLTDAQARALAQEGKSVVWIDGGLHATEVLGAQQLIETTHQLISRNDPETTRILNDVIVLVTHANPDGMELVSDWYMRNPNPQQRSTGGIPRLYQKYVGHDNNRDFYIMSQPESRNINQILYREWYPQIVYNHHQTGPGGTVMFAPPFRNPFNYNYDPLVVSSLDLVGSAMHTRFLMEAKPGVTSRSGANYSTWWNGGLRTMVYFHNMVGLLTETIGNPTPTSIPFNFQRYPANSDMMAPIAPQAWPFRNSVDYSVTANYAVLDLASRYREQFLHNIWRMGMNSIERGNTDTWTMTPKKIAEVRTVSAPVATGGGGRGGDPDDVEAGGGRGGRGGGGGGAANARAWELLRRPEWRDPRGFILPADQPDFPTATKFVNALLRAGITVHRASTSFTVNGKQYPAGSYVVKGAQAFRPHVMDMFEPQDHPNDVAYPGGPPIAPYDNAGYTLAYQMGVQFDRILEGFDGPFEKISGLATPLPGRITQGNPNGYYLSHGANDAFIAINRLLKSGEQVFWLKQPATVGNKTYAAGTFYIPRKGTTKAKLTQYASELGLNFDGGNKPRAEALALKPLRIGLWDQYGGSMPSGHTRWILEQFEFPFEVVFPQQLDAGDLKSKYDVLVFVSGGIPAPGGGGGGRGGGGGGGGGGGADQNLPEELRRMQGSVTADKTIPQIKAFLEAGGTVLTIGSSTSLARHLALPVESAVVDASGRPLGRDKFFVPGSVLRAKVDTNMPLAHGLQEYTDFFYDNSPAFKLGSDAASRNVRPVAWFDTKTPLRSGWAWGQEVLENAVAVAEADVGSGKLYLFGPEILFRSQPHGTFKLLFNGMYLGTAATAKP